MATSPSVSHVTDRADVVTNQQIEEAYFLSLGRFIHTFSQIETVILTFLGDLTGLPPPAANAVLSGVRVGNANNFIRRIYEAKGQEPDPAYASVICQLGHIVSARDQIVHYGATFERGSPSAVTNARSAHTEGKVQSFPISSALLDQMTDDLREIQLRIEAAMWRPHVSKKLHRTMFGEIQPPAWQYKHAAQPSRQDKNPTRPQGSKAQHSSSRK